MAEKKEPLPFRSDPKRLRRELDSAYTIGSFITGAAEAADEQVYRALKGPAPSDEERALIAGSPRRKAELFTNVLIADLSSGERERYTLVEEGEADIAAGRVSVASPLGRALYQASAGAIVQVKAPGGVRRYRVLQVE